MPPTAVRESSGTMRVPPRSHAPSPMNPQTVTVKPESVKPVRTPQKSKIVFVIDDIGHQKKFSVLLQKLGNSVTYAILPDLPESTYFARLGRKLGAEIILHLPLEALDRRSPGPGTIRTDMSDKEAIEMLNHDLASVPYRVGVNNHMGSRGTSDPHLMRLILSELKRRDLFFLDSYTTLGSSVPDITRELNLPFLRRSVFLDNEDSPEPIRARINDLAKAASNTGFAVGIGHYRENTLRVLNEEIPRLKREGYQIVTLSEILRTEF